jgi:hypothetical protein
MVALKFAVPSRPFSREGAGVMTDERDSILGMLRGKKEPRVPIEQQDHLGNRKVKEPTGKKLLGVWLNPAAIKQFNMLAAELEIQKQDLMAEALNDLFEKHHKKKIA